MIRMTIKKTTIVRTSTKLTTPITITTWSDGSSTKVKGEVQKEFSTENIVSLSSTKENIEKLISNKDLVITDSDTNTASILYFKSKFSTSTGNHTKKSEIKIKF